MLKNFSIDKKKALLARKEQVLQQIQYYEKRILDFPTTAPRFYHSSSDSEDESSFTSFPITLDVGPSIGELKQQERLLRTCLQATQELTGLGVLQSEVNVMVEDPAIEGEKPVSEPGTWREVTAECRIDLVPFSITFYTHQPSRRFAPTCYRGLKVLPVKNAQEAELKRSVLSAQTKPADAVELLRSYASAYRSRRTSLARLADKHSGHLYMEPLADGGFMLKCANLLSMSWILDNRLSAVAPFHHKMSFELDYMDESYLKIIKMSHRQLADPSLQTDERTLILSKIISTCLEAQTPAQEMYESMESDQESAKKLEKTTLSEDIDEDSDIDKRNRDKEVMAPPKTIPRKAKPKGKENVDVNRKTSKRSSEADVVTAKKAKTDANDLRSRSVSDLVREKDRDSGTTNDNNSKGQKEVESVVQVVDKNKQGLSQKKQKHEINDKAMIKDVKQKNDKNNKDQKQNNKVEVKQKEQKNDKINKSHKQINNDEVKQKEQKNDKINKDQKPNSQVEVKQKNNKIKKDQIQNIKDQVKNKQSNDNVDKEVKQQSNEKAADAAQEKHKKTENNLEKESEGKIKTKLAKNPEKPKNSENTDKQNNKDKDINENKSEKIKKTTKVVEKNYKASNLVKGSDIIKAKTSDDIQKSKLDAKKSKEIKNNQDNKEEPKKSSELKQKKIDTVDSNSKIIKIKENPSKNGENKDKNTKSDAKNDNTNKPTENNQQKTINNKTNVAKITKTNNGIPKNDKTKLKVTTDASKKTSNEAKTNNGIPKNDKTKQKVTTDASKKTSNEAKNTQSSKHDKPLNKQTENNVNKPKIATITEKVIKKDVKVPKDAVKTVPALNKSSSKPKMLLNHRNSIKKSLVVGIKDTKIPQKKLSPAYAAALLKIPVRASPRGTSKLKSSSNTNIQSKIFKSTSTNIPRLLKKPQSK